MQSTDGFYRVTSQEFLDKWSTISQEPKVLAIFMAGLDETGKYWCPDCENTRHNLDTVLIPTAQEKNIPLYHVDVGNKETWKDPENHLRKNEAFQITKVPTLVLFENGKITKSVIEEECHKIENVRDAFY